MSDANSMHQMISHFADKGEMLPRALSEIYDGIRDYFVVRKEVGLSLVWRCMLPGLI